MIKKVCILGCGESGIGAALLAQKKNFKVFVSEFGEIKDKYKIELIKNNIPFEEKGHSIDKIKIADLIIKSPGIPQKAGVVLELRELNIPIVSEIDFASRFYEGKIIGITGSNGKTTTTSLVYHILSECQIDCRVAGNIGHSFARLLSEDADFEWAVLELSSFQLEDLMDFHADIAVVLNITPDHLDRYEHVMYKYASAKWNITSSLKAEDLLIINKDSDWLKLKMIESPVDSKVLAIGVDESLKAIEKNLQLIGAHNLFNANMAYNICKEVGIPEEDILKAMSSFRAIPHRLESVAIIDDVEYINDSKATNVDSAEVALSSMGHSVIWIAGGTDKGNDYGQLQKLVKEKVKTIICLTMDDSKLRSSFKDSVERIESVVDMGTCVDMASKLAKKGYQVLLSPACASFDLFNNYEHRGDRFREEVLRKRLG